MPRKNVVRQDAESSYYHVYNRGVARMDIFLDDEDFRFFEWLLARHLSKTPTKDKWGREFTNYAGEVELHTYCLMPNHYHLLLWQREPGQILSLMKTIGVTYAMYFNKKYQRRGPVFESSYKTVLVDSMPQFQHLSRYIHLNPVGYRLWDHSSYSDFLYTPRDWITTSHLLELFDSKQDYLEFVDNYDDAKRAADALKAAIGE